MNKDTTAADILYQEGKYKEAMTLYTQMIEDDALHVEAYEGRGLCCYVYRDIEQGIKDLVKAISLDEKRLASFYEDGTLIVEHGSLSSFGDYDMDLAKEIYQIYVEHLSQITEVFFHERELEKALGYGRRLRKVEPNKVISLNLYARVLSAMGYYEEAIEEYERILILAPDDIASLHNMGFCLLSLERYVEAIPYFDRVLQLEDLFSYAYANRGFCKYKKGLKEEGIEELLYSLKLTPDNSYAYYYRGVIHYENNEIELAKTTFEKALELGFGKKYGLGVYEYLKKLG